jgi:5-methylthioadenosine/S-adenosylhomocysteine deaminase
MQSRASVPQVNLLIRGGYVLTMDSAGDLPGGDVHVRDGEIKAIGRSLDVPEAELIDASGKIVAPGLVDTHAGTRLACAEAIDGGITTVHDWAHNIRAVDYAHAGLAALRPSRPTWTPPCRGAGPRRRLRVRR